ncbi:MAG TPA: hypothetical protein VGD38_06870 [Pyrinomonadaceae bacterium]
MKILIRLLSTILVLGSFTFVRSQKPAIQKNGRAYGQQQQLKKLLSRVGVDVPAIEARNTQPKKYRELKIRLSDPAKSSSESKSALSKQAQTPSAAIVEDKKHSGALPRQRSLELSPTQIFIAGVDATNKLRWWSIVPDPRVVRSETQSPTGELRSEDYYVSNVTLVVAFPDDPEITNLRFYRPVWNGTDYELKSLTNVPTR